MKEHGEVVLNKGELIDTKKEEVDLYEVSLKHEEEEALRRTESEDREMFEASAKQIKICMREIVKLKTDKPEEWAAQIDAKKTRVLMLLLAMRKLGRVQKVRVKHTRDASAEARQTVDVVTLQLQNLLYEVAHLNKEIRRCMDFHSADKEIELLSLERFYAEAPESISRAEETLEDPHQQRLAQLHWELEQRRGQTELFEKLTAEKKSIEEDISSKEGRLKSLRPMIDAILKSTLPLQTALDLPLEAKRLQNTTSEYLPVALRTLWLQASSYASAVDPLLTVSIEGDLEAAKKMQKEQVVLKDAEDSDAENDIPEIPEEDLPTPRNPKTVKKTQSTDSDDVLLKNLLKQHPLNVRLMINTKEGDSITICFFYCMTLEIVTTKMIVSFKKPLKPSQTNVMLGGNLLNNLFPGDLGATSPNPSTVYFCQKAKIPGLVSKHFEQIGKPFLWAQTLCGLVFQQQGGVATKEAPTEGKSSDEGASGSSPARQETPPPQSPDISWKESSDHMHATIKAIRMRLRAKLSLQGHLIALEKATNINAIPLSPESVAQHFPSKISSQLVSWKPMTWVDYEAMPHTASFRNAGLVDDQHIFFKVDYRRQEVIMKAFVSIAPNYPKSAPTFALCINWRGEQTAANNPHVKQMESEVNLHWAEMISEPKEKFNLLCYQLYRLAMCLDIFTEAKSATGDPKQKSFHKEKIFFRPSRGPDRALPFKYIPKLGVFDHR